MALVRPRGSARSPLLTALASLGAAVVAAGLGLFSAPAQAAPAKSAKSSRAVSGLKAKKAPKIKKIVKHPAVELPRARLGVAEPIFDPSGKALQPWHEALTRVLTGKSTARIAFYGASHTAADLWTGELRRRLQQRYGDGGHGFVLPTRFNLGYRHQDLVVESSKGWTIQRHLRTTPAEYVGAYGLSGMVMLSADPTEWAEFRTTVDNPQGRSFDRLQVWVAPQPGGGHWWLDIDGQRHKLDGGAGAATLRSFDLRDTGHVVRLQPAGDGPVGLYGAVIERSAGGVVLDQLGIPGMKADIHLHWQEAVWADQMARRRPDLIVLAYGTNDVAEVQTPEAYAAQWLQVLQRVRKAAPQAACVIVGPSDRLAKDESGQRRPMPRTPEVIAVQKKVAAQMGCGHWDAVAAMGGPGSMEAWRRGRWATKDGVHLTRDGYTRLAELFDAALHSAVAKVRVVAP